jgi:hypothetical protein
MTRIIKDEDFSLIVKDGDFDFGFTAVTTDELDEVRAVRGNADEWQQKAQSIYNMILPLLTNLKQNPEKDYIHWPNRTEKIEQFQQKLLSVLNESN